MPRLNLSVVHPPRHSSQHTLGDGVLRSDPEAHLMDLLSPSKEMKKFNRKAITRHLKPEVNQGKEATQVRYQIRTIIHRPSNSRAV